MMSHNLVRYIFKTINKSLKHEKFVYQMTHVNSIN